MSKEVSFKDVKHMVAYVLDTKDQELIEEYAFQLLQLRKESNDGIRYEVPKVEFNDKTYYGTSLEVKDGKVYVDGVLVEEKTINYSGTCIISNNKTNTNKVPTIRIVGDLTSYAPIETEKVYCDSLFAHGDINTNRLNCDGITSHGDINVNGNLSCDDVNCNDINVNGNLSADDIEADGDINTFKK